VSAWAAVTSTVIHAKNNEYIHSIRVSQVEWQIFRTIESYCFIIETIICGCRYFQQLNVEVALVTSCLAKWLRALRRKA
jgi:hypothetical protein